MIGSITGIVRSANGNTALVDVHGVGYRIFATKETILSLFARAGEPVTFFTHLAVRETALDLYGFITMPALEAFELLLTVSGIGPKSALAILDAVDPDTLMRSVAAEDAGHLSRVGGIGKKTAEKIVHELKGKAGAGESTSGLALEGDAILALEALGYSQAEARNALKDIPRDIDTAARITQALKQLGN